MGIYRLLPRISALLAGRYIGHRANFAGTAAGSGVYFLCRAAIEWRISFLPSRSDNEVIADLCQDVSPISKGLL